MTGSSLLQTSQDWVLHHHPKSNGPRHGLWNPLLKSPPYHLCLTIFTDDRHMQLGLCTLRTAMA